MSQAVVAGPESPPSSVTEPGDESGPVAAKPNPLTKLASWRVWAVSAAILVPFVLVFFVSSAPFSIPAVEAACGQAPLDMRFFTDAEGVADFLNACGPAGRDTYRNMQLADLVYPTAVGVFVASSLALAIRRLSPRMSAAHWLPALPLLASSFDYLENAFVWIALASHPGTAPTNDLLGFVSAAKTISSWAGGIALLTCLVILGAQTGRGGLRLLSSARTSQQ